MNRVVLFSVMVVIAAAAGRSVVHSATTNRQIACPISPTSAVSRPSPIQVDRSKTRSRRGMLVVIDPGHGGSDPGTHGPNGVDEKTVTLAVGRDVAPLLKRDRVRFIMTRDKDKYISLPRRVAIANRNHAALFVSLHCDEYSHRQMHGFTVIYAQGASRDSRLAARLIAKGLEQKHFFCHAVRAEVRHLYVLDKTNCPAVLVEMGFMSDPRDLHYLCSTRGQHRLARGIAHGIVAYLHAVKHGS